MFTEPKPTKTQQSFVTFYTTSSGRVSVESNMQARRMCVRVADKEHVLNVSLISKDYIRKHADQIDALVAWVTENVRNDILHPGQAGVEIVERYSTNKNAPSVGT